MEYEGKFRTVNEEMIQVIITTNNDSSTTQEIFFDNDEPVIIAQTSDGIFSPVKSRSCTVGIVSKDTYFDMYSASSHGTTLQVNNLSKGICLFNGFVTPCQYNQPYTYINRIEIEAVDAISTLKDYKYTYITGEESTVKVVSIIRRLMNVANVSGSVYIPKNGNRSNKARTNNLPPMDEEYINEGIFFDDEGEAEDCYTCLEEICNFYGLSCIPDGEDIYFVDYELIDSDKPDNNLFVDITANNNSVTVNLNGSITKGDYSGDDQNIQMDEVYNKISVKSDVKEIDDDKFYIDPLDYVHKAAYIKRGAYTYLTIYDYWKDKFFTYDHTHLEQAYNIYDRYFYYTQKRINNKPTNTYWQCYTNTNVWEEGTFFPIPLLHDTFSSQYLNYIDIDQQPIFNARLARYEYQWCTINQQFGFKVGEDVPIKVSWKPYIEFHTGVEPWARYYNDINSGWGNSDGTHLTTWQSKCDQYGTSDTASLWWQMYSNELMRKPVLEYRSDTTINYSPANNQKKNYICFTGDLLWQKAGNYGEGFKYNHSIFVKNTNYKEYLTFPLVDAGYSDSSVLIGSRSTSDGNYNKGWSSLKCRLQIGNKYWNGGSWTTVESDFWIPYHKKNVSGDDETLEYYVWNKPVTNHTFESGINEDCFAIPITETDKVYGKLIFQIYNPMTHYMGGNAIYNDNGYLKFNIGQCIPVIFMQNLSLSFKSANNYGEDGIIWSYEIENKEDEDDIIYSNTINSSNVLEFDELSLKVATYNSKKPISKSYILDTDYNSNLKLHTEGFYDTVQNVTQRQEMNIIGKYHNHFSSPKKIYNCEVHGYYQPYKRLTVNAVPNTQFIVDEQEYDVKADTNQLKLIEY